MSNNLLFIRYNFYFHLFSIKYFGPFHILQSKQIKSLIKIDNNKKNIICLFPDMINIFSLNIKVDLNNDEQIMRDKGNYDCNNPYYEIDDLLINNNFFNKNYIFYKILKNMTIFYV